jgi:hypothetical protein
MRSNSFREEIRRRGWIKRFDNNPATHLLLDGGALCVSDSEHSKFLNVLFSATLRGETVCVVEQKTPVFNLFFDIDAQYPGSGRDHNIEQAERDLSLWIYDFIFHRFYDVGEGGSRRMIACLAPPKKRQSSDGSPTGSLKCGMHLYFPGICTNSRIAMECRRRMVEALEDLAPDTIGVSPLNSWKDVVDEAVFKGSGLRTVFSHKGKHEKRAYVPRWVVEEGRGLCELPRPLSPEAQRDFIHECSIRVFHHSLTPCVGGEHTQADNEHEHHEGGHGVTGKSTSIQVYSEALPVLVSRLPVQYRKISFVRAFVSTHAVYLKSTCKYCLNVGREHNTSTIYVQVTKQGATVRCYCRKEEYHCASYKSPVIDLPKETLHFFFPDMGVDAFLPDVGMQELGTKSVRTKEHDMRVLASTCFRLPTSKRRKKRF